jgi:heptosyltransferase-3
MMAMNRLDLPPRPRVLVVTLRRIGDVLLTTPLIRSLRRAWPEATIDALVFADTAGILAGNPDLDNIVTIPPQPSAAQTLILGARLFRGYDLAVSTQSGDRPTGFAIAGGRACVAPVAANVNGRVKEALLTRCIAVTPGLHRVEEMLRLADALGIARVPELVCPRVAETGERPAGPYAVIHAAPMFRYKQWTMSGWRELAGALTARGLNVIATGGPAEAERHYLDDVWNGARVTRRDGELTWSQLAGLLSQARVYIGPDTSVTHLAAASGCPTVALYGPTDPRLWGPWPVGGMDQIWTAASTIQRRGNVWLVQNALPCMPCQLEGCERRLDSYSQCLDEMAPGQVIAAADQALAAAKR